MRERGVENTVQKRSIKEGVVAEFCAFFFFITQPLVSILKIGGSAAGKNGLKKKKRQKASQAKS